MVVVVVVVVVFCRCFRLFQFNKLRDHTLREKSRKAEELKCKRTRWELTSKRISKAYELAVVFEYGLEFFGGHKFSPQISLVYSRLCF